MQKTKKKTNFNEIKFLITAISVTSVIGFWNLFAKQAVNAEAENQAGQDDLAIEMNQSENISPLPTLVKLHDVQVQVASEVDAEKNPLSITELREAEMPTPQPIIGSAPVVDTITLNTATSQEQNQSQGQNNVPNTQPTAVTTTSSSK